MSILSLLWACAPGVDPVYADPAEAETEWVFDIRVSPSPGMPTVLEVQFSSSAVGSGWVTFVGPEGADRPSPRSAMGTDHDVLLLGVPPLDEVPAQACVELKTQEVHCSETFWVQSGGLSPDTPHLTVTVNDYADIADPQTTLLMSLFHFSDEGHVMMTNLAGEVFWSTIQGPGLLLGNGALPIAGGIAYNTFNTAQGEGHIEEVSLQNTPLATYETPGAHHFFDYHPEGGVCWLAPDVHMVEGKQIVGDQIYCMDDTREIRRIFTVWDHLVLDLSIDMPGEMRDWTHGNWLHHDPQRGTFLFSAAYVDAILELSPSGEVLATFFGSPNDAPSAYLVEAGTPGFRIPHGAHWAQNGDLLMFVADDLGETVRAARYAIDPERRTLREVWSYTDDNHNSISVLGEVQELADGNYLVSWGGSGVVQIVSPEGALLWELLTDLGELPSQIHLLPSPYL